MTRIVHIAIALMTVGPLCPAVSAYTTNQAGNAPTIADRSGSCGEPDMSRLSPATAALARRFYGDVTLNFVGDSARSRLKREEALGRLSQGSFSGNSRDAHAFFARRQEARERLIAESREAARGRHAEYNRQLEAFVGSVPASERNAARAAVMIRTCVPPPGRSGIR